MYLNLLGEGGTEHHGLTAAFRRHCILFHNASNLWFKTHVQHAVSLIQDQVTAEIHLIFNYKTPQTSFPQISAWILVLYSLAIVQSDLAPLHHINQTSWCGHQQVTASLQFPDLLANISAAVHHAGTHT